MRVPTRPLFKPFDYALIVVFAMAFIMLTALICIRRVLVLEPAVVFR